MVAYNCGQMMDNSSLAAVVAPRPSGNAETFWRKRGSGKYKNEK